MSISKRIETIASLVSSEHEHVYDLCCDHGLIGLEVLKNSELKVIFVDIIDDIMKRLELKLKATDIPSERYNILTSNATKTSFEKNGTFIIAGVGGELAIKIIQNILDQVQEFEIIISANNNLIKLKEFLIKNNLLMAEEVLIKDNRQFYEILKITNTAKDEITHIGTKMWQKPQKYHFEYIEQQISYYKKSAKYSTYSNKLLSSYESLKANSVVKEEN